MARPLRINRPELWYHVTARGTDRKEIFRQESDRWHWLELLPEFIHLFRLKLHAYVLMSNHYHLLVEVLRQIFQPRCNGCRRGWGRTYTLNILRKLFQFLWGLRPEFAQRLVRAQLR